MQSFTHINEIQIFQHMKSKVKPQTERRTKGIPPIQFIIIIICHIAIAYSGQITRNSSGDEIANVNFLYDDIVHVLQNTIQ